MSLLKSNRMSLMERLTRHVKKEIALQAQNFDSGPGVLQHIGKRFIRVDDGYYIPYVMEEIVLFGAVRRAEAERVLTHTTYAPAFVALLNRTGSDFLELTVDRPDEEEELTILIPFNKVIGVRSIGESDDIR